MKKLLLLALAACLPFSMALAQMPDPANFHIWFGTIDGSALSVGLDKDIEVPVWGSTDPTPGNPDSVNFAHVALQSNDTYIITRSGGFFPAFGMGLWDDRSFLGVNNPGNDPAIPVGFQSQSFLGFAYLTDPRDEQNFIYTLGAKQLLATYRMHTANDVSFIGNNYDVFAYGHNPANGGTLWGMQDGVRNVVPTPHFAQLYFSPNAAPIIDAPADGAVLDIECQQVLLAGHDIDTPYQTLTFTASAGTITQVQVDGTVTGVLTVPADFVYPGPITVTLSDGADIDQVTFTVNSNVGIGSMYITSGSVAPGGDVDLYVVIDHGTTLGGFEIKLCWDPSVATLYDVDPTSAISYGWEYFNWVHDPSGPGTGRFVWIWDTPENDPNRPPDCLEPGLDTVLVLKFQVASGLPFSADVPICFCYDNSPDPWSPGDDYTSNTYSDCSGNNFFHPCLTCGHIFIADPLAYEGDPNMNCYSYEVGDAVLVAQRLIHGMSVWNADDAMPNSTTEPPINPDRWPAESVPGCERHYAGNNQMQEAAGDLNGNGHPDIADLIRFINILNGFAFPKVDPAMGHSSIFINDGAVRISSDVEVGGVLVTLANASGTPVANNGMDLLYSTDNGKMTVLVYSMAGTRIPAGDQVLFTIDGGNVTEASTSDIYGYLMETRIGVPLPVAFSAGSYPNPFNAKALIQFALPEAADVTVNIYSITGQLVETLGGHFEAGYQSVNWDASQVASGVYFAKVSTGTNSQTLKMTLLK